MCVFVSLATCRLQKFSLCWTFQMISIVHLSRITGAWLREMWLENMRRAQPWTLIVVLTSTHNMSRVPQASHLMNMKYLPIRDMCHVSSDDPDTALWPQWRRLWSSDSNEPLIGHLTPISFWLAFSLWRGVALIIYHSGLNNKLFTVDKNWLYK